jgi:hypothetical protein
VAPLCYRWHVRRIISLIAAVALTLGSGVVLMYQLFMPGQMYGLLVAASGAGVFLGLAWLCADIHSWTKDQ